MTTPSSSMTSIRSTAPALPCLISQSSYDVGWSGIHSATPGSDRTAKTAGRSGVRAGRMRSRSVRRGQLRRSKVDGAERESLTRTTLDGVGERSQPRTTLLPVKTFDQLWAELAEKAEQRPPGSGTV